MHTIKQQLVAGAATISMIAWQGDSPVPYICKMLSKVKQRCVYTGWM